MSAAPARGSYVRADAAAPGYTFGLLIPELGRTEIFEPICRGMAEAQHGNQHVLLWGSSLGDEANMEQQASQACCQLVAKKVSGVVFAPLELTPQKDAINRAIAEALDRAGISHGPSGSRFGEVPGEKPLGSGRHRQPASWLRHHETSHPQRVQASGICRPSGFSANCGRPRCRLRGGYRDRDSCSRKPRLPDRTR